MPPEDNSLQYRALLEISEALIACRDYDALSQTLWDSLHKVIRFDYLVLLRHDEAKRISRVEAIAGADTNELPVRREWPLAGSPLEIVLATQQPLYVPELARE